MSKEQIIEYVMNTPGNTNRTILGQMIDSEGKDTLEIAKEMDAVTLALAKQYTDKQVPCYEKELTMTISDLVEFPYPALIGLKVVDELPGRVFLQSPAVYRESRKKMVYQTSNLVIQVDNYDGGLSEYCLLITGSGVSMRCPTLFSSLDKYDSLMYAYVDTTDNLGLGLQFDARSWYMVNTISFDVKKVDMRYDINPFIFSVSEFEEAGTSLEKLYALSGAFNKIEKIEYTVTEQNILTYSTIQYVSYAKNIGNIPDNLSFYAEFISSLAIIDNDARACYVGTASTVTGNALKYLDQKFMPPLDSLILNGADGKQYKVTVDESGALTATVIE